MKNNLTKLLSSALLVTSVAALADQTAGEHIVQDAKNVAHAAKDAAHHGADKVKDAAHHVADAAHAAKDKAGDLAHAAKDKAEDLLEKASDGVKSARDTVGHAIETKN